MSAKRPESDLFKKVEMIEKKLEKVCKVEKIVDTALEIIDNNTVCQWQTVLLLIIKMAG